MAGFLALNIAAITAREQPETFDDGKSFWCEAPLGWKKRVTYRSAPTVNNKSKADVYFYAPLASDAIQTTRFRSEKKLREYLLKNTGLIPDLPPPEAFDWSYPGGTREGKCKNGPPLSFKAAPDTPRHGPVKTTGKRDPRKRPRDSPKGGPPVPGEQPPNKDRGFENGASERTDGSDAARPSDDRSEGQENKTGEESNGGSDVPEAGPPVKKKKGNPSGVVKKNEQGAQNVENAAEKPETKAGFEVGGALMKAVAEDKADESAMQQKPGLSGTGDKQLFSPPAPPKRKGRPPRVKKEGVEVEKTDSAAVRSQENGAASSSGGKVNSSQSSPSIDRAAASELPHEDAVRGDVVAGAKCARLTGDDGAGLREADLQKAGAMRGSCSVVQVPQLDPAVGIDVWQKPGNIQTLDGKLVDADLGKSRGGSEGLRREISIGELARVKAERESSRAIQDQDNQAEFRKRALVDTSETESSPPLSEMEVKQSDRCVKAAAKEKGIQKVRDSSSKAQVLGKLDVKIEKVGNSPRGSLLDQAELSKEGVCEDVTDQQAQELADGSGTPLSILDRAGNGGVDTGPNPTPTEERSPARKEEGEESGKAPLAESPELQCSESVPSPEQTASGEHIETAPSASQPELEAAVTKAMRKKARLAKVLGPHEVVERPRRERSGPPTTNAPRGIADAVKMRTAGFQAEKKNARQQVGERVYTNRMPQGLSVSALIAAAAAAPPSPVPRIRGRPPKQRNVVGTSRLGGGKQTEEDAEEKRAQQLREEHEAAVKIFQEEETERERVLKERGWFHPPDETLADRPKPPPLKGKRRTKSALIAEHWERLAQAKLERGEDGSGDWLLPEDGADEGMGASCERDALRTELNGIQREARIWMKRGRSGEAGDDGLGASGDTWDEKSLVRKKRNGGRTAVRTQKRTALANGGRFRENRGGDAGPSRRRPSQPPGIQPPYMPSDPEPDPTYDSDANSSELKMGQKLDEHGFFERDDFEVASQETCGRKPPRERLPLEAPPQRRRSFGHRKGPSGIQVREGVRKPMESEGGVEMAMVTGTETCQGGGESGDRGGDLGLLGAELESNGGLQEEVEKETKRMRWEGPWGPVAGAGPLLDNGLNGPVGRRSAEPMTSREHFTAAPTVTSF